MKIGGSENPFLKRLNEFNQGTEIPSGSKANEAGSNNGVQQTKEAEEIKKPGMEEGAASGNQNPEAKLDKSNFTNEDDIQELDLQEFEDDFN